MSRDSDDNLSSIHSTYTDMYQETVQRFTRSSLSPELDRYPPSRISTKSTTYTQHTVRPDRHSPFDLYLEATGRRASSDHGAVLTVDTEQFIIGQRVWVGGIRPGQIAYIGETHFAPGEWAGVVLDEPNGKNDGCVANKRYFQCEPKRGIFSRLTRLTLAPLPGAQSNSSPTSKYSPDRSRTVSPSASVRSSFLRSPSKNGLTVGDRVIVSSGFGSRAGILRYLGETQFASGNWCGVELDEATGKNDGSVDGIKYFECKPKYGVFVPIAKVSLSPSSKKAISRLSRTGSRESLTSVGTMNSVATTNTSRLRMNSQRKSPSIKPISTPKSQFSMQDLLREKQNHIEQLMIERDLDREDAQTQALHFQKNISEVIIFSDTLYAPIVYSLKKRPLRLAHQRYPATMASWHSGGTRTTTTTITTATPTTTTTASTTTTTTSFKPTTTTNASAAAAAVVAAATSATVGCIEDAPIKRSSLVDRTTMRSPTPPTKKVWFCDKKKLFTVGW